jgi:hypothetical protein
VRRTPIALGLAAVALAALPALAQGVAGVSLTGAGNLIVVVNEGLGDRFHQER